MKKLIYVIALLVAVQYSTVKAQDAQTLAQKEEAYKKVVHDRAAKIVVGLNLSDDKKASKLTDIIAQQYQDLNAIYIMRDDRRKAIKESAAENKDAQLKSLDDEVAAKINALHPQYLARLSKAGLTPDQVNAVKDGMTYDVLHVTYKAYLSMLPNLTEAQKTQIMAWLTEAREYAMDAESSNKKHAWFGKYKGRVNNYLSAAGVDMKKEEAAWMARLKEEKDAKQTNKN